MTVPPRLVVPESSPHTESRREFLISFFGALLVTLFGLPSSKPAHARSDSQ